MQEEGNLFGDKIDKAQSKEESKAVKYLRMTVTYIGGALFLTVVVGAIVRK
jgi:hypothetical protein